METYLYSNNKNKGDYNLIMAYPAIESFALSSLGYLWLYKIADTFEGINAIRCSTDNVKSYKNIGSIAFSLSFDFDFMGVFDILKKLGIAFYSKDRKDNEPLLFAGGPVLTTNPRPYEQFFDFMIVGDGELCFKEVLSVLKDHLSKTETLKILKNISGVYVPKHSVKRAVVELDDIIYTPILSDKSYFKDTFIIELARGCMNRCAFCTASYTNLPFRHNSYDSIIQAIDLGLNYTNKIALLGAQISAHPQFNEIMNYLSKKMDEIDIELGISSLRTDSVDPFIVQTLVKGGQKHSTIAIEAASDRLRKYINKNLKEEQILNAVRVARENGLKGLKIYSMIGLPTETYDDLDEFLVLAKKIKSENKGFNIEFSFSSFVPKPHTPFQWSIREDTPSLERKQKYLEKLLKKDGILCKFSSIKWDYWQAVLSRGGTELAPFLLEVYKMGGKIGAYKKAFKSLDINIKNFFQIEETLPWDIIEMYPGKKLLINELKRLKKFAN